MAIVLALGGFKRPNIANSMEHEKLTQSVRPKKTYRSGAALFRRVGRIGWKKSNHYTYTFAFPVLRRWLLGQIPQRQRILSIGCGTGELEKLLELRARLVIGTDLLLEMARGARRRKVRNLVQTDAHVLPFATGTFDTVILPETLGYIDPEVTFLEVKRVLKKGGLFLVTTYPVHLVAHSVYKKRSADEVTRLLKCAGFSRVEKRILLLKQGTLQEVEEERRCSLLYLHARLPLRRR